jgi:hypothetical protein
MVEERDVLGGGTEMNSYYVELRYFITGASPDALDAHTDAMMAALLVEPGLTDPDVGVNFETGAVDVCVNVSADDQPGALRDAMVAIRSAAHSAGAATAGWDNALPEVSSRVRPTAMVDL